MNSEADASQRNATVPQADVVVRATMLATDCSSGAQQRYFNFIAGLLAIIAVLKGLRMPSLWAATHMTLNYSYGFVRRGLVGEVLRRIAPASVFKYNALALLAGGMFVGTATLVAFAVRRVMRTDPRDLTLQLAVCVFLASPGMVFFVHMIGYFDYLGLMLVLAFIFWSSRRPYNYAPFYVGAILGVAMDLVHEGMLLMFGPVLLFVMTCHIFSGPWRASYRRLWLMSVHALGAVLVNFCASAIIATSGTRSPQVVERLRFSMARHANFPLRRDAYEVLIRPVKTAAFWYIPAILQNPDNVKYLERSLFAQLPAQIFLIIYGTLLIGRLGLARVPRVIMTAVLIIAALAPLLLNFVGTDAARWGAISTFATFCCIVATRFFFTERAMDPLPHRISSPALQTFGVTSVVLGLCTSYPYFLFDGYTVQWFPFAGRMDAALELFRQHFSFIPGA